MNHTMNRQKYALGGRKSAVFLEEKKRIITARSKRWHDKFLKRGIESQVFGLGPTMCTQKMQQK